MKKLRKLFGALSVAAVAVVGFVVNASAAELPSEISSAFQTGISDISGGIFDVIGMAVPVVLGILVVTIATTFGIKWIKRLTGRA